MLTDFDQEHIQLLEKQLELHERLLAEQYQNRRRWEEWLIDLKDLTNSTRRDKTCQK